MLTPTTAWPQPPAAALFAATPNSRALPVAATEGPDEVTATRDDSGPVVPHVVNPSNDAVPVTFHLAGFTSTADTVAVTELAAPPAATNTAAPRSLTVLTVLAVE